MNYRYVLKLISWFLFVIITLVVTGSCQQKNVVNEKTISTIDINAVTPEPIYTEEISDSIEYVFLETTRDCSLIDGETHIELTDKYIIAYNDFGIGAYLFDRKTGKFCHEIGSSGEGPDEYLLILSYPFNEKDEIFYAYKGLQRIGFDINKNTVAEKVIKPITSAEDALSDDNYIFSLIHNIHKIDGNRYIAFTNNDEGDYPNLLIIFDKDGNIIKSYPNHQKYTNYDKETSPYDPGWFYEFDSNLFFKEEQFNDTVFQVSPDTITPHIVFELGEKKPDYSEREDKTKNQGKYWIQYVQETNRFIFFNYNEKEIKYDGYCDKYYDGYYDKENKKMKVTVSNTKENRGFWCPDGQFPPFHIQNINKYGEAVGIITSSQMLEYKEQYGDMMNFDEQVNNLKFDDNPIVVIAKIKK
jgi:hypothetical protein